MQSSPLKKIAIDAAQLSGAERPRRQAWIHMFTSDLLRYRVRAAPEIPCRGTLNAIALDGRSVDETVVTFRAMSRGAQSIAAGGQDSVALLLNAGTGRLRLAQRGRTIEFAVGDATLCDNAEPWKLSSEPHQIGRILCFQIPRDLMRPRFTHAEDRVAVSIPARSPALALAHAYMEGMLSVRDFDNSGVGRLAFDHLAALVSAALVGAEADIASQPGDTGTPWTAPLRPQRDIAFPSLAAQRTAPSTVASRAVISSATFDLIRAPILTLDPQGHCIDTNAAADRLLAATRLIRVSSGVLVIADHDAHNRIATAVEAARAGNAAAGTLAAAVALTLERKRHFVAHIVPLRQTYGMVALLLEEIGNLQPLPCELLVKLYGLTRAEARLVTLLAQDLSLDGAAAALGIARTTAKTHLQHVFEKTDTSRQPQVVRLVLSPFARWAT
jgi:DNA-binding CsgD family transcriptional regulator/PAS domain-containing protein